MKLALYLFLIALPFMLVRDYFFDGNQTILDGLSIAIPFMWLLSVIKKELLHIEKAKVLKAAFLKTLKIGFFFSFWMGTYHYFSLNHLNPTLTQLIQEQTAITAQELAPGQEDKLVRISNILIKKPFFWITCAMVSYTFLFGLTGCFFGVLLRINANKR